MMILLTVYSPALMNLSFLHGLIMHMFLFEGQTLSPVLKVILFQPAYFDCWVCASSRFCQRISCVSSSAAIIISAFNPDCASVGTFGRSNCFSWRQWELANRVSFTLSHGQSHCSRIWFVLKAPPSYSACSCRSSKILLHCLVFPFRLTIGLRAKCSRESVISVHMTTNSSPQSAGEFFPLIGNDIVWYYVHARNVYEREPCQPMWVNTLLAG